MGSLSDWVPMKLTYLGDVHALLTAAGGKLSIPTFDDGVDTRKPKGQEPH